MLFMFGRVTMLRILQDLLIQRNLLISKLFRETTFYHAFRNDLLRAKKRIVIESPYLTERRASYFAPLFQRLVGKGIKIRINTRHLKCHDEVMRLKAKEATRILLNVGVKIYTYNDWRHWKLAIIDNKMLWEGSLNILSHNKNREIMRRSKSRHFCSKIIDFAKPYD